MSSKNRRFRTKTSTRDAADEPTTQHAPPAASGGAKQKSNLLSFGDDEEEGSFRVNKPKRQDKSKPSKFRHPAAGAMPVPATLQRAQAPAAGESALSVEWDSPSLRGCQGPGDCWWLKHPCHVCRRVHSGADAAAAEERAQVLGQRFRRQRWGWRPVASPAGQTFWQLQASCCGCKGQSLCPPAGPPTGKARAPSCKPTSSVRRLPATQLFVSL
jgi:hypothetical protein